jgi:hypothetical protein
MNNSKWINSEEILKQISEIGNFKGSIDILSGALEWYDKSRDLTIFATPNWNTDGEVPFDVDRGSGLEIWNVCTIKMVDEDKSTQFTHYLNVLMMIMNHYSEFTKPTENV